MDTILSNVDIEFHAFKEWILTLNPVQIWSLSNQISFYQDVYEYFSYASSYPSNAELLTSNTTKLIQSLWILHLKSEIYDGSRWDEISFLLTKLLEKHEKLIA